MKTPKYKKGDVVFVNLNANAVRKPPKWKRATINSVHLKAIDGTEFSEPVYGTTSGTYHESDIRAEEIK